MGRRHRISSSAFRAQIDSEIAKFDSEMRSSSNDPDVGVELLPVEPVAAGEDPDIRWEMTARGGHPGWPGEPGQECRASRHTQHPGR